MGRGAAGAVVMTEDSRILCLASRQLVPRRGRERGVTNVEAEYAGLVLGMELAGRFRPRSVEIQCDCEVVVRQMRGEYGVKSPSIKPWHRRACELARGLGQIRYVHIRRSENQIANGLAGDALQGRVCQGP